MIQGQRIVLIVDDDLAVRESLKFSLGLEGLTVHACASGAELLVHPELRNADCLVLDCKMPVMDGFEALARLAAAEIEVPVILLTSHSTEIIRRRAAAANVKCILEKPLLDSALADSIHDLLSQMP